MGTINRLCAFFDGLAGERMRPTLALLRSMDDNVNMIGVAESVVDRKRLAEVFRSFPSFMAYLYLRVSYGLSVV